LNFSSSLGYNPVLIESTQKVNQEQPNIIMKMVEKKFENLGDKTVSVLGLAFKKNTDDIRESVSIKIVNSLLEKKVKVRVHDPIAMENFRKIFGNRVQYFGNILECLTNSQCCLILTDWDEYGKLEVNDFKHMTRPLVIDARRMLDPNKMNSIEFMAIGFGEKDSD